MIVQVSPCHAHPDAQAHVTVIVLRCGLTGTTAKCCGCGWAQPAIKVGMIQLSGINLNDFFRKQFQSLMMDLPKRHATSQPSLYGLPVLDLDNFDCQ